MKKILFYLVTLVFAITGCSEIESPFIETNDEIAAEQVGESRTLTLFAEIPNETSTRIALEKGEDNKVKLTWEEGDKLELCFVQGGSKVKEVVTIKDITNEGKKASFDVPIPSEFGNNNFDLYGVYGGGGLLESNPTLAILPTVSPNVSSLSDLANSSMLSFSAKDINAESAVSITFRHIGSLFCLIVKNSTDTDIENVKEARLISETAGWAYNSVQSGKHYNLIREEFQDTESAGNSISLYANGTIAADNTLSFWGWFPPLSNVNWPKLKLELYDGNDVKLGSSTNVKPARTAPTAAGKSFYFYAVMNDKGLHFTDNTFTPPLSIDDLTIEGDLRHAAAGSDYIGMVYTKAGNVYYNQAQLDGTWGGEVELGTGSDPRIVVGFDKPHVVYVQDNKIVYQTKNGTEFTEPVYIESNFSGQCSKPDIAVDGSGFVHITYTDTKGNTGDYTDRADIMYAENSNVNFEKTLVFNGYYDGWEQNKHGSTYANGSRIAVNSSGEYFILTHVHRAERWLGGSYTGYFVIVASTNASGTTVDKGSNQFGIYDIGFDGTNIIAFYKNSNVIVSEKLTVSDNKILFSDTQNVSTSLSINSENPGTLLALPGQRILGAVSDGKVFVKYGSEKREIDKPVKSGTVVSVAKCGVNVYAVYTDSSDDMIRLLKQD